MTTGTVTTYNPSRGTGTVAGPSGGRFPFTARGAGLAVGDVVVFRATGGIAGLYALDVQRKDPAAVRTSTFHRPTAPLRPLVGGWTLAS